MRVILLIGRLCCGKSTYARQVIEEENAVLLSADEVMQTLFPDGAGEAHDMYARRTRAYLYGKARQMAQQGMLPLLDFGFWNQAFRKEAADALAGLELDWRYLDVSEEEWRARIARRSADIEAGLTGEYYVDEGLLAKLLSLFEPPTTEELPGLRILHT